MKDIFFFEKMFTPKFLTLLYWIFLAAVVVSGFGAIFVKGFFVGVISMVVGLVWVRIMFEAILIAFKNNEYLRIIAEK